MDLYSVITKWCNEFWFRMMHLHIADSIITSFSVITINNAESHWFVLPLLVVHDCGCYHTLLCLNHHRFKTNIIIQALFSMCLKLAITEYTQLGLYYSLCKKKHLYVVSAKKCIFASLLFHLVGQNYLLMWSVISRIEQKLDKMWMSNS